MKVFPPIFVDLTNDSDGIDRPCHKVIWLPANTPAKTSFVKYKTDKTHALNELNG